MIRRRARPEPAEPGVRRRGGPVDEERWWRPEDQVLAESELLRPDDLGRGWRTIPMVNNVERREPFAPCDATAIVQAARDARVLTALDEGEAWRRRNDPILAVARVEVFASADDGDHRRAWQTHGPDCLDVTWRARWRERDVTPGWIEASWLPIADRPVEVFGPDVDAAVDWITVEDQTRDEIEVYEYVAAWCGRLLFTLTVRHRLGIDLRDEIARACVAVSRRSDPRLGSA